MTISLNKNTSNWELKINGRVMFASSNLFVVELEAKVAEKLGDKYSGT